MKVIVKQPFFDETGLHRKGEVVEINSFNPDRMELIEAPETEEKIEKKARKITKR